MEPTIKTCPTCNGTLRQSALGEYCPKCLLKNTMDFDDANVFNKKDWDIPDINEIAELFPELDSFSLIARGGMGVVYKARQVNLNRWVALKVLPPEISNLPQFAERFSKEAQALAALNHHSIVTIYDFGIRFDFYFFIMEFVPGETLSVKISEKMNFYNVIDIIIQLCQALQYAHENRVIHCDLKPENIIYLDNGRIVLTDFGIAHMAEHQNNDGEKNHILGTKDYMPPEQKDKNSVPTVQNDIYSLGILLYKLLTGSLPRKHNSRVIPINLQMDFPVNLSNIVIKATAFNPNHRYKSMKVMQREIEKLVFAQKINRYSSKFAIMAAICATSFIGGYYYFNSYDNKIEENKPIVELPTLNLEPIIIHFLQSTKITMQPISPGLFKMGSTEFSNFIWEQPIRLINISKPFWISATEITQLQYRAIMSNNITGTSGAELPITSISWSEAMEFCQRLNELEEALGNIPIGYEYRLPTEAEWEFVADGGHGSDGFRFAGSDDINEIAWFAENSKATLQEVGTKKMNRLGIFDLCGNAAEWCYDYYSPTSYQAKQTNNPIWKRNVLNGHVVRGGSFATNDIKDLRKVARSNATKSSENIGFRVVLAPKISK